MAIRLTHLHISEHTGAGAAMESFAHPAGGIVTLPGGISERRCHSGMPPFLVAVMPWSASLNAMGHESHSAKCTAVVFQWHTNTRSL